MQLILGNKGKLVKSLRKFGEGGNTDSSSKNGEEEGKGSGVPYGAIASGAGLLTPIVTNANPVAGGVFGGATSGAATGAALGPWGALGGAVIGGTIGGIEAQQQQDQLKKLSAQQAENTRKLSITDATQRGLKVPVNGNQTYSLTERKLGGGIHIKPSHKGRFTAYKERTGETTEEALHSSNAHVRQMANFARNASHWAKKEDGGKLEKLSNNTVLAKGATHENGGIKLPQLGAEVENNETLKTLKDGGTYVMSDSLMNPTSGNTFAKDDMKLSRQKGSLEKIGNAFSKNALTLLKSREGKLVNAQEGIRKQEGLETDSQIKVARNGGKLYEYVDGGKFKNSRTAYATKDSDIFPNGESRYSQIGLDVGDSTFNPPASKYNFTEPNITGKTLDNPDVQLSNEDGFNPSKKKFDSSSLSKLSPYIDNIIGAYKTQLMRKQLGNIPKTATVSPITPTHVNYSQAIKNVRDENTAFGKGVSQTNANSGNANIMKAYGLGQQMKSIAGISQEESNKNTEIDNSVLGTNAEIQARNNETVFNNEMRPFMGNLDLLREGQQNVVNFNSKLQGQLGSQNKENLDKEQSNYDEKAFPKRSSDFLNRRKGGVIRNLSKLKVSY